MIEFAINLFLSLLNFAIAAVFWNVNPEWVVLINLVVGAYCFSIAMYCLLRELR